MLDKKYWLLKTNYYNKVNETIDSDYDKDMIDFFTENHPKGVYVSYDGSWGHMPYPRTYYGEKSNHWYDERDYTYLGELSVREVRKQKIKKLAK